MENKMRVWWMPQMGTNSIFYVPVKSVEEARKVMDILGAYDAFQLQHMIKPDYFDTGGLEVYNPETGEYEDWYVDDEYGYYEYIDDYLDATGNEEVREFAHEVFKQIDWKVVTNLSNWGRKGEEKKNES